MGKSTKDKQKKKKAKAVVQDRHYLYSAAVQSTDADIAFFRRVYRRRHRRAFETLREDFCGTALLAHDWVRRDPSHEAWGVDLDGPTLSWGKKRYTPAIGKAADRLHLIEGDVLDEHGPPVDVVAALNFSYSVFHDRPTMLRYVRRVRDSLRPGGMFFMDVWGGTDSMQTDHEERKIPSEVSLDGTKIPKFTYEWEQHRFNPIDHRIVCLIHFELKDGTRMRRAFRYDWRLWTLPELRDLMEEAGFASSDVYVEGWDDEEDDSDGVFRKKKSFENQEGWIAYLVGHAD